ncbi:PorV/PorQ family protein [candidate division KSB1 bacterium]
MKQYKAYKIISIAIIVFIVSSSMFISAQQPGMAFLRLSADAAGAARGGALTASGTGLSAVHWNPAGLAENNGHQIYISHIKGFEDTNSEYAGLLWKRNDRQTFALTLLSNNIEGIEFRTKPTEEPEGNISAHDLYAGVSFAYKYRQDIHIGLSAKYLYQKIYLYDATGFAGDLGVRYIPEGKPYKAGIALRNIGSMQAMRSEKTEMPALMRAGATYTFTLDEKDFRSIEVSGDYEVIFDGDNHTYLGVDFRQESTYHISFGYVNGYDTGRFSYGGGVSVGKYGFDYAYLPEITSFGNQHILTLRLLFN